MLPSVIGASPGYKTRDSDMPGPGNGRVVTITCES